MEMPCYVGEKMNTFKNSCALKSVFIACCLILSACVNTIKSTPEYHSPPAALKEKMKSVMPSFEPWIYDTERRFAATGEMPSGNDIDWAKRLNIKNIDNIRIVKTEFFPMPQDSQLLSDLEFLGWGSPYENTRNMGYTIFIRPEQDSEKVRAEQIALIYLMENMGRSRFLYRSLVEQRSLDAADQPLLIEAKKLATCAVINGKVAFTCSVLGTKPKNHAEFEKARKEAEKAQKLEQDKRDKLRKEFQHLQKDNLLLDEIKNEKSGGNDANNTNDTKDAINKILNTSKNGGNSNIGAKPISAPNASSLREKTIDGFIIK
jgi:hypothetical protein